MVPCECALTDAAVRLGTLLDTLEQAKTHAAFTTATKKVLAEMRSEHKLHLVDYKEQYARNMIEIRKLDAINNKGGGELPVQTSVWTQGDERKIREKPVKKGAAANKKRPNLDGGVAVVGEAVKKKPSKKQCSKKK
jgi:hypothetical protein